MKHSLLKHLSLALLCVFALLLPQDARADVTASILGVVSDAGGHVIPNATVRLSNKGTGYVRSVIAGADGAYQFLSVPVGEGYAVTASTTGFETAQQTGVTLTVNQRFRADFALAVGKVTEQVTVRADSVQVDTSTTQLGDVVSDKKMISLPLNGRSYTDLLGLQPGVVPVTSSAAFTDRPVSGGLNAGGVSVNGSQESANSFLINGGDVQEPKNNGASIIPSLDSIQEFRILTNTFDAEYGRFAGGIVNVLTKTGTNSLHGSLYEFLRNEKLNAKNFFDTNQTNPSTGVQIPNTARGVFKRNQFGFAVGGPIVPNKVFFFTDYQGTRQVRGQAASTAFIPSPQEITGNFGDVTTTGYGAMTSIVKGAGPHSLAQTLSQRLGYTVNPGEPYWVAGCVTSADAAAGKCVFPNQVIPISAFDSAAKGTIGFIPAPSGSSGGAPFFSTSSLKAVLNDDKIGERINWNGSRTGDWSFYFTRDWATVSSPFAGGNIPGFGGVVPQKAYQANIGNTRVFHGSMVNEFRLNYTRSTIFQTHPTGPGLGKLSSFGFGTDPLGLVTTAPEVEGVPSISIGGAYSTSFGVVPNAINEVNNNYQLLDHFSMIVGRHSLKFGGEGRQIQVNEFNISTPNGSFSFDGTETGNGFADYLIGASSSFVQQSYSTFFTKANYAGFFVQDAFRVKPNVTINAGLRWEMIQPFYEKENRLNAINYGQQSTVFPGAPTGWVFPGDTGIPNTVSKTPHNNFSPRLGVNWSPGATSGFLSKLTGGPGKTSIRAGSGLYYTAIQDQPAFYTIGDAPFGLYYSSPAQVYFSEPFKDRRNGNDPGQHFPFTPPVAGQNFDWSTYLPIAGSPGVALGNVTPYTLQFNVNVQRELPGAAILTAAYVGTRGHHLLGQLESNIGVPSTCLAVAAALPAGQGCGAHGEDTIYTLPNGSKVNGTRIHSVTSGKYLSQGLLDFGSNSYNATIANSNYNSLQLSLSKHLGLSQFLASYTFSRSIDNASGNVDSINPLNPRLSRSLSAFDLRQNFVISYGASLPSLRGHSALLRDTVGAWELTGISRFTTGLPVTLQQRLDQTLLGTGGIDLPNWDGQKITNMDPRASAKRYGFDPTHFSTQPLGTNGNASRRFFSGPGIDNFDMALRKFVPIHERYSVEFRAEFFNVFNHAQFLNPGGRQATSSFGRVTAARDPRIGQVALRLAF